jgi:hypothetical protein
LLRTYTGARRPRQVADLRDPCPSDRRLPTGRRAGSLLSSCLARGIRGRVSASVDASRVRAYHDGSRDPIFWSPFLRVGARTLRTEQCAKSQCVYPVDIGRCGSPCLPARRSYGKHHRKADPGVLLGEADFPTHEPETGPPKEPEGTRWAPGPTVLYGEFDPGSGRTLAACLTHASRAGTSGGVTLLRGERRTGE